MSGPRKRKPTDFSSGGRESKSRPGGRTQDRQRLSRSVALRRLVREPMR